MIKKLLTIIFLVLFSGNAYATDKVNSYLSTGYKIHTINSSGDGSVLFYHLVKEENRNKSIIITCIVNSMNGDTVSCYKP
jgi:hypothetical protein